MSSLDVYDPNENVSRQALAELQLDRLRWSVAQAAQSSHYGPLLSDLRLTPDSFTSLDDLRQLPFTEKQHLRDGYPYGMLAVQKDKVVRMHHSSGTTGMAVVVFHTKGDIDRWAGLIARCLHMIGLRPGDVFQNMMGYGLFTGGLGLHYGAEKLGALVIPTGAGNSRRQIQFMQTFDTAGIHIIPSYALALLGTFADMEVDPKELSLRLAVGGAEPYSEGTRERLQEAWSIPFYNCYGLSEMQGPGVAFECPEQQGLHLWEDSYLAEVIDPDTGESVEEGEEGELVLTTLTREAMPLLRYRTRDLTSFLPGDCPCGRTHRRLARIQGRADDMFIVKGVNIFPLQIERVLMSRPEVGHNYLIVIDRDGYVDRLTVRVELTADAFRGDLAQLREVQDSLTDALRQEILVRPRVELVEPGALPRQEGKAIRVVDERDK
ncbi:MAG: phenylacetate--CoA ligase [Armatimonadetes bacterium]|nr:phenylacetate--CoA ligase [Armatimonadota bacterium]